MGVCRHAAKPPALPHARPRLMSSTSFRSSQYMNDVSTSNPQQQHDRIAAPEQKPISPRFAAIGAIVLLAVAMVLAVLGIMSRKSGDKVLADRTQELAAPTVIVAPPKPGAPLSTFMLPGNVTAFSDAPIYARTS